MRAKRPIYIFAKPSGDALAAIGALRRTSRARAMELLHTTLLPLFDLADAPPHAVHHVVALMDEFRGEPFDLMFDAIAERRAVTLRSTRRLEGAIAFQQALATHFRAHNFPFFGRAPEPHLTINYRRDGGGNESIRPVGWRVDEVLLVESVVGETRHVVHGRWTLSSVDPLRSSIPAGGWDMVDSGTPPF